MECISPDGLQIWEFAWSPDGSEIAGLTSDLPTETDWYLNRLDVFPSEGGPARTLYDTHRSAAQPKWSPDGRQIAFTSCRWSDKGQANGSVFVVSADGGGEAQELTPWSSDQLRVDRVVGGWGQPDSGWPRWWRELPSWRSIWSRGRGWRYGDLRCRWPIPISLSSAPWATGWR